VPAYSASKGGLIQLTRSLAAAWATDNIQVNAILPGWITTDMTAGAKGSESFSATIVNRTPARRWGEPADFEGPAVFLASPASDFVTGHSLAVDGGFAIQG
jgi:2-deoxy-D-gluconate 3-dehydrogenase